VLVNALDRVSVQLKLTDKGRWEVDPFGTQLGERHRQFAGTVESLEHPQLRGISERHLAEASCAAYRDVASDLSLDLAAESAQRGSTAWSGATGRPYAIAAFPA
jgi:hypothetical protein